MSAEHSPAQPLPALQDSAHPSPSNTPIDQTTSTNANLNPPQSNISISAASSPLSDIGNEDVPPSKENPPSTTQDLSSTPAQVESPASAPTSSKSKTNGKPARGRGRPKGTAKKRWTRPKPNDSSAEEEEEFYYGKAASAALASAAERVQVEQSTPVEGSEEAVLSDTRDKASGTTKSGRRVKQPATIVPSTKPAFHRRSKKAIVGTNGTLNDTAYCSTCSLGHSPPSNRIALCDGCNLPYHQLCHVPAISNEVITEPDSTWFCFTCETKRVVSFPDITWESCVTGAEYTQEDKDFYLSHLPHAKLIQIIKMLTEKYPESPIYPQDLSTRLTEMRDQMEAMQGTAVDRNDTPISLDDGITVPGKRAGSSRDDEENDDPDFSLQRESKRSRLGSSASNVQVQSKYQPVPSTSKDNLALDPAIVESSSKQNVTALRSASPTYLSRPNQNSESIQVFDAKTLLPSYEDMLVEGLRYIDDPNGSAPRTLFEWMNDTYPLMDNFRPSASQALQKGFKRGRLLKVGILYKINPDFQETDASRRLTRKPKAAPGHPYIGLPFGARQKPKSAYATPAALLSVSPGHGNNHKADEKAVGEGEETTGDFTGLDNQDMLDFEGEDGNTAVNGSSAHKNGREGATHMPTSLPSLGVVGHNGNRVELLLSPPILPNLDVTKVASVQDAGIDSILADLIRGSAGNKDNDGRNVPTSHQPQPGSASPAARLDFPTYHASQPMPQSSSQTTSINHFLSADQIDPSLFTSLPQHRPYTSEVFTNFQSHMTTPSPNQSKSQVDTLQLHLDSLDPALANLSGLSSSIHRMSTPESRGNGSQ